MRALLGLCRRQQQLFSLRSFRWLPGVHLKPAEHALTPPPRSPAADQQQLPTALLWQWSGAAAAVQRQLHVLSRAEANVTKPVASASSPLRALHQHGGDGSQSRLADQLQKIQDDPDLLLQRSHRNNLHSEWEVIEFLPDASYKAVKLSPASARLDPRDVSIFMERLGYSNQRATLAPREGAILFRTEVARAIIRPDRALVFACRREKDTLKVVQAVIRGISGGAGDADTPFELRALEALLAETVRQFERHHKRLLLLSDSVEREIMVVLKTSSGDLTRLLPIQKRLTEMRQDVAEARDAVKEVLDSDKLLAGLCLSEQVSGLSPVVGASDAPTEEMREAALLLESYERQISTVEGALKEKQDYLEVVREVWAMQLDATRNRIIRIDLIVAIASFAMILPTVPAAFFGMNLQSGMEDSPAVFWPVVATSLTISALAFLSVYAYWKFFPNSRAQRRINDVRALHDLLTRHMDDLEDVMQAMRDTYGAHATYLMGHTEHGNWNSKAALGKKEFGRLVRRTIQGREVPDLEVDLLYRVFDKNRDGFLNLAELVWSENKTHNDCSQAKK